MAIHYHWVELIFFISLLLILSPLLGAYLANVFTGKATLANKILGPLEQFIYRITGANSKEEMSWIEYGKNLLWFNLLGFLFLVLLLLFQSHLPWNPQNFENVEWPLALNTAISFVTNTNWQAYAGETTLSYFTQMVGLTSQNFLSAATGMAALLVLIRGFTRKAMETVGNFWQDLTRMIVYVLLPLSALVALLLVSEGVIQTLSAYVQVHTLENSDQIIPLGPVASQIAIKQLGTNGGGFFNTNSAHPFENPTPLTNLIETLSILLIPAATVLMYGRMVGSQHHGRLILTAMLLLWIGGLLLTIRLEHTHNNVIAASPVLEGMETRFGMTDSLLWSTATTATSNGSVNAMLSSLSPLAGGICLFNIMLGEIIFGGVGVGLGSMIMFILLTVFLSGLMVGRTPEYLGKKIEKREMQWVVMAIMLSGVLILMGAGISAILPAGIAGIGNQGPHGLTEILYAFASAANNNGSSFAGLDSNTAYYNLLLGATIFMGRLSVILPCLAIGGLLAKKKALKPTIGTFSTDSLLFLILLISIILIVGALTFFPALALGPVVEHLLMIKGDAF